MPGKTEASLLIVSAAVAAFLGVEWLGLWSQTPGPTVRLATINQQTEVAAPNTSRPKVTRVAFSASEGEICDPQDGANGILVGDQIALRVFETVRANQGPSANPSFERRDLSGTFTVETNGDLSIPGIGRLNADRLSLACLETRIESAMEDMLNVTGDATVRFAARMPVLIQGVVAAPGSYDHTPGLTVRRLLARSGLSNAGDADAKQRRALKSQLTELELRRDALVLTLARFNALQDDAETLDLSQDHLARLEQTLGETRVDQERALLSNEIAAQRLEDSQAESRLTDLIAARELAAFQRDATLKNRQRIETSRDELAEELGIECRGRCSDLRVTKEIRLDSLVGRASDLNVQSQDRQIAFNAADAAVRMHEGNRAIALANRRTALAQRISAALETKLGLETQMTGLKGQLAGLSEDADNVAITVEGLMAGNEGNFIADLDTLLMPGDLVSVSLLDPDKVAALEMSKNASDAQADN